jgi:glycogen synthase
VVPGGERVGLRFRSRDHRSLARTMEKVLTDEPLRGRLVAEAREHVRGFGWPGVAREMVGLYAGACGARV